MSIYYKSEKLFQLRCVSSGVSPPQSGITCLLPLHKNLSKNKKFHSKNRFFLKINNCAEVSYYSEVFAFFDN